ncbi:hypothetical protein AMQ83_07015 [Paenibacillus riograndensis]|nr:hypothetical protein AMQ83_07015 [Paenibacillus riograndensis]
MVIGKDSKTFTFLMNEYGYILAINYAGQVFLIRRDPVNEPRRISAILHKQHWTPQDDVYKITRIADKDIVPTLQLTPLLSVHQVEEVTFFGVPLGSHDGTGKHAIDTADENDFISELVDTNDQFQIEELLGSEADKALNPLYLILETWSAQREATKKLTQQLDEEQRFLEEEEQKRRISELLPTSSTGSVMLQEKEHDNITHSHPDIAEPNEMENLLTEEHSTILSINRRPTNKVLDEIVHSLPLYGIKLLDPMDIYGLNEKEASLFLEYIYGQSKHYPSIDIFRNEETIWNSYVTLPQEKRHLLERNVFPEGLPAWFMEKKFPFDRKQIEIQKKETMKLKKNSKQKDNVQPSWEEQMGFDY